MIVLTNNKSEDTMIKLAIKIVATGIILSSLTFLCFKLVKNLQSTAIENNIILASFNQSGQPLRGKRFSNKLINAEYTLIRDVDLSIEDTKINSRNNILCKNNRYYFDTYAFESVLGYKVKVDNNRLIAYSEDSIDTDNKNYMDRELIHDCLYYRDTPYVSMIDLTEALNLTVAWDYEKNTLNFYKVREIIPQQHRGHFKRPALIRFEDVAAGTVYANKDSMSKLRIISDLMYSKNLPFHIAWIPRYMDPEKGIDNNLLENYSLSNVDFIYTLDYMISRGGIVGIHGYTHQYGAEESIVGSEFGDKWCSSLEETEKRIEAAINTAKELDIPYEFFESPHYRSTKEQQQAVFEKYFDYMFEPSKVLFNTRPAISKNNRTIYVPAALGYVHDEDADDMINRIKTKPKDYLTAFFYHPTKEFQFITLKNDGGYPSYEYSENSILHKLLKCLNDEGYALVKITDIKLAKKTQ
jgi:hypothetical protein